MGLDTSTLHAVQTQLTADIRSVMHVAAMGTVATIIVAIY